MKYGNHELHTFGEDVEPIRTVELPTKPEISMKKGFVKMKFAGPDGDELEGEGEGGELPGRILNRPKGRRIESFSHFASPFQLSASLIQGVIVEFCTVFH